ncbi:MAG TPA: MauE/DoxX family redox-associated membrane protein [Candidatus Polarisedimenticolia bacterium]
MRSNGSRTGLRTRSGHLARIGLGMVWLLAAAAKAVDPLEFAHEIASYGLIGASPAATAAPLVIALEAVLGVMLLAGAGSGLAGIASCVLMLAFLALKIRSLLTGRTDPCGCFGSYLQTSPGWGIALDVLFLAAGLVILWGLGARAGRRGAGPALLILATAVLSLAFAVASPRLPLDRFVTRLSVGRSLADLGLEGRVPGEGRRLVALLDLTDPASVGIAARLESLASAPGAPAVVALTASSEEEQASFVWSASPTFEIKRVDRAALKPLYRALPRFFVVDGERVIALFDGAPPEASDLLSLRSL